MHNPWKSNTIFQHCKHRHTQLKNLLIADNAINLHNSGPSASIRAENRVSRYHILGRLPALNNGTILKTTVSVNKLLNRQTRRLWQIDHLTNYLTVLLSAIDGNWQTISELFICLILYHGDKLFGIKHWTLKADLGMFCWLKLSRLRPSGFKSATGRRAVCIAN